MTFGVFLACSGKNVRGIHLRMYPCVASARHFREKARERERRERNREKQRKREREKKKREKERERERERDPGTRVWRRSTRLPAWGPFLL